MRRQGASIFIYVIFGILIAIFVINFGPQARQRSTRLRWQPATSSCPVDGDETTQTAYHIAYANPYNRGQRQADDVVALETLIRRELLAQEAEERGLIVTDDLIDDEIKKGHFFLGGQRVPIPGAYRGDRRREVLQHAAVKSWVGAAQRLARRYHEEQKRSMLAAMMAEILDESVAGVARGGARAVPVRGQHGRPTTSSRSSPRRTARR